MLFNNISPFVRFSTKQELFTKNNIYNYDQRFYFCLNGCGVVTLNGKKYEITQNSFLLWRAGTLYSYETSDEKQKFEVVSCNFDYTRTFEKQQIPIPPVSKKFFDENKLLGVDDYFSDCTQFNEVIFIREASFLRETMLTLAEEFGHNDKYRRLNLNFLLTDILLRIAEFLETKNNGSQGELLQKVLAYLHSHYLTDAPTLEELSRMFSYHPNYLNQLILKKCGLTIHQYILHLKMNKAMKYLMTSNYSIQEISQRIGLSDPRYFSRIFKKKFGVSPSFFHKKD